MGRAVRRSWALGALATLGLVACSSGDSPRDRSSSDTAVGDGDLVVPRPAVAPELADARPLDRNGNRLDDVFDAEQASIDRELRATRDPARRAILDARLDERVNVEAVFSTPVSRRVHDAFVHAGGSVRHVFRAVSYGFTGTLRRGDLAKVAALLGPELVLLKADRLAEHHLDEATRTGRVRPVWAPSFGGYSGAADINIAIMDTGLDGTHTDLAGRSVGWKDYTSENAPSPIDIDGHGSHVAGIALGSGAAFGLGPGTLNYTDSGDLTGRVDGDFLQSPVHLPPTFTFTSSATWIGGATSTLSLRKQADGTTTTYTTVSTVSNGASGILLTFSGTSTGTDHYSAAVTQNGALLTRFAAANSVSNYPAVGDGFPALRGVASSSGWFGAKIFPASGNATSADIGVAMDDMVVLRSTLNIKVVNMSFGILNGGVDTTLRAKTNTMVANGIVVVTSNGNNGSGVVTADPGRAANAITVGATNDVNQLTQYTSGGSSTSGTDDDDKPDILAPGGSFLRSRILSVDSNSSDAQSGSFSDVRPNDYTNIAGTSMSAPFVAGASALVVQALQRAGTPWSFNGPASPFLVKTLLLASATETNAVRETGGANPPLGRSSAPKDLFEGYGIINPDAAIEAASVPYADFSASTTGSTTDRRAWGRNLTIAGGKTIRFNLTVPAATSADFDLYLYASTPGPKGNPVLLAAGDVGSTGQNETVFWTAPAAATTVYVIVKRISGSGTFTLTSAIFTCGNGTTELGEQCDDSNGASGDCCSKFCQFEGAGSTCSDGNGCTQTDTCNGAGTCVGSNPVLCAASDACHDVGTCSPATGICSNPAKPNGSACNDGDACTQTDSCQSGICVGGNPVICGAETSCAFGGTCNPATGACGTALKPDGTPCDDGNACSQTDTCQAGACIGGNPVICAPPDDCHTGACNTSGACSFSAKDDGTPCSIGVCLAGTCTPPPDGGSVGDGGVDAGDGGDAGDAGDGGSVIIDAGPDSSTLPDSGVIVDAGGDGSIPLPDSGVIVDAALPRDAASSHPSGSIDDNDQHNTPADNEDFTTGGGGCGCKTAQPDSTSSARLSLAGLAILGAMARRRRRHPRTSRL